MNIQSTQTAVYLFGLLNKGVLISYRWNWAETYIHAAAIYFLWRARPKNLSTAPETARKALQIRAEIFLVFFSCIFYEFIQKYK